MPAPSSLGRAWAGYVLGAGLLLAASVWLRPYEQVPAELRLPALVLTLVGLVVGLAGVRVLSRRPGVLAAVLAFVLAVLASEALLRAQNVPAGLIPTPSRVAQSLWEARAALTADLGVTFLRETLVGYCAGVLAGLVTALLVSRSRFLELGLLPYTALLSSVPIVALAPVVVRAAGLEWPSKAVIVAITVFFPVVLNVSRGLNSASPLLLDLARTYAMTPAQVLARVRIPAALPYLFNALKVASTLALIGAVVGEFFGSTGQGLGFRIQIEAGRFNLGVVWAAIVVTAALGLAFFGAISLLERWALRWQRPD
ncbi:NitT/TauT family transport system permease protein [Deinococcus hopiensis KR-140]|uniref:NitT/TauT family transport system permease protein n=2 Tax=Deinococcus TaxID=1298 RepID=A0A1W1US49_9DEIO|nr:NitT/TauT family transport system permease protein [Deinococcus hopiensis KR-140]